MTGIFLLLSFSASLFFVCLVAQPAAAVQTVPHKVNFQGQLTDTAGATLADGQYNMTFRLYDESTAGTAVWTEVRETASRVTLTDGRFSVQLGDVSSLPPSVFNDQTLYFEVELPTPATATCDTASCAVYTEGPMTPRQPLAASPYAFNADQLDGYDASDFAIGGANNTFTATNLFKTDNTNAFAIQNTNGDSLLSANTTNMEVSIGTSTDGVTLSGTGIQLNGSARGTRKVSLMPEYAGATFRGDGTNNIGSLSSDFCADAGDIVLDTTACTSANGVIRSYYQWTSDEVTAQDYDIYVRYRVPADYSAGSMANLTFEAQSTTAESGQNITASMYGSDGTLCSTIDSSLPLSVTPEWQVSTLANPLSGCPALAANGVVVFKVSMAAVNGGVVRAGEISFDYRSKF